MWQNASFVALFLANVPVFLVLFVLLGGARAEQARYQSAKENFWAVMRRTLSESKVAGQEFVSDLEEVVSDPSRASGTKSDLGVGSVRLRTGSGFSQSSRVRLRASDPKERAARRAFEYLKVVGLPDSEEVWELSLGLAHESGESADELAAVAVRRAQAKVAEWRAAVFEGEASPDPLWLRAFLEAKPEAFFISTEEARKLAKSFGDPMTGAPPRANRFRPQSLEKMRFPRWLVGLLPALALAGAATYVMAGKIGTEAPTPLRLVFLGLFFPLLSFVLMGLSTSLWGLFASAPKRLSNVPPELHPEVGDLRTAVIIPIYHESAEHVFAAVLAMRESLLGCQRLGQYEIFVLSDSRDPLIAADEERAFRRVAAIGDDKIPVYYRRRSKNTRQKAGNLEEFFERFGHRYRYAVVLDADSVMVGPTIVELVRRMEAAPETALMQAPIEPMGGETVLARSVQWASSVSGPLLMRGLSAWAGASFNYYGHNAILRVRPFLECCALPALAGEPPLGGHILSHDFVEAALLRRKGYAVRAAPDLGGSYEGLPPTLQEFVARDRRWCQGNLQHLRIAVSAGLAPMSRVHMVLGAFAYLAGPAWLLFLATGLSLSITGAMPLEVILESWLLTSALLLGPRVLGMMRVLANKEARRTHGGALRLLVSGLVELLFSAALAPLMMLHHTSIVLSILLGRSVRWGGQSRRARAGLSAAVRSEWAATLLGVTLGAALIAFAQTMALWLAPVWVPLALSIPIAALASSARVGTLLRRAGILAVPSETHPDPVAERVEHLRAVTVSDSAGRFRDLILDPVLVAAHLSRQGASLEGNTELSQEELELCRRALRVGPASLEQSELERLLESPACVRYLHAEAWCAWPVESWEVSRERPQLPPALPVAS